MAPECLERLRSIFPGERLLLDPADRLSCSFDASFGEYVPEAVVQPKSKEEIAGVMRLANEFLFPVCPRGAATSLSGGPLPVKGGLVLDLSQMRARLEIDRENMLAIVSPGIITGDLHREADAAGLFYPPDPSSSAVSTIGGNLLENAGGPRGLKYGTTKEYVIGLEAVAPTGEIFRTGGRTVKNVTGYDLTRLIVGSEGTLAVVTEAIVRLLPRPRDRRTLLASFPRFIESGRAITRILASGILPAAMEMMDNACIRAVEAYEPCGLPADAEAVVIIEVDGHPRAVEDEIEQCARCCREAGARDVRVASGEIERDRIWRSRRMISPAIARMGPTKISEDATVPRSRIPGMMERLVGIREKHRLNLVVFGHAGDGNLHPNIITDKRNKEEMRRAEDAVGEIFQAALELGGTLSGEHGIGIMKSAYMEKEVGEAGLAMMRRIKDAWDPNNILNPGKIFPEPGRIKVNLTE